MIRAVSTSRKGARAIPASSIPASSPRRTRGRWRRGFGNARAREREAAAAADAGEASEFESSPAGSTRRFLAGGEPGGGGATASLSSDADDEPADRLGSDGSDEDSGEGEGEGEGEGGAWRLERERLEAELAKARAENAALAETLRRRDEALRALAVGGRGFDGE